jgi:hypothetical protein
MLTFRVSTMLSGFQPRSACLDFRDFGLVSGSAGRADARFFWRV